MKKRPAIQEAMKREIRQRCGFGCVICGIPLYEYEHMLKWSVVKRHVASEITLLCRFHHGQRTSGLLPIEIVREANLAPYNLNAGASSAVMLHFTGRKVDLKLGGNSFNLTDINEGEKFCPLIIDRVPVVSFVHRKGRNYLSLNIYDDEQKLILKVVENEIVIDTGQWDVEWVGKVLTIRQGPKRVFLKIEFRPPGDVVIEKGTILYNGIELIIGKNYLYCSNIEGLWQRCSATNSHYGLSLGVPPLSGVSCWSVEGVNRENLDRAEARKALRKKLSASRWTLKNNGVLAGVV
ncbi:cell division protein [Pseudomonas lurida]|uniref:cell division protein n=1 Tax=Pseudomonas lurida TaxID=244566 RepID=UPI0015E3ED37|nr:cell division protein [Pseudomonas lurida]MBA1296596.1 cell division protein [Pseudomonas lurida]